MRDTRRTPFVIGLFAGALLGLFIAAFFSAPPRVVAQAPSGNAGRFQVSTYSVSSNGTIMYGAFVVDGNTGDVYHCQSNGSPKHIGQAVKP